MIEERKPAAGADGSQPRRKKRRMDDQPEHDAGDPLPTFGKRRRRDGGGSLPDGAAVADADNVGHRSGKRRRVGEESLLAAVAAATAGGPSAAGGAAGPPGGKPKKAGGKKKKKKRRSVEVEWPPATAEQLAAAGKVVRAVARGDVGWPFEMPVTNEVAPGYSREIARPMDLGTIAKALKRGDYTSLGAVLAL